MTVQQFLAIRFLALSAGDYAAVYDSYHFDAPFRQQFSDRNTYISFARQQLSSITIKNWHCQQQRQLTEEQVEVLLVIELELEGKPQFFYELALLIKTENRWLYHSAQKLGTDDYTGAPKKIKFCNFDNATQKIRY